MWYSVVPLALSCLPPANDKSYLRIGSQEHQTAPSAWEESPTAYRLGLGSPTRLVRFGLAGAATISESVGIDGALPFDGPCTPAESWAGSAVFFLRPRVGFRATSGAASDAWITLAGSCSGGVGRFNLLA